MGCSKTASGHCSGWHHRQRIALHDRRSGPVPAAWCSKLSGGSRPMPISRALRYGPDTNSFGLPSVRGGNNETCAMPTATAGTLACDGPGVRQPIPMSACWPATAPAVVEAEVGVEAASSKTASRPPHWPVPPAANCASRSTYRPEPVTWCSSRVAVPRTPQPLRALRYGPTTNSFDAVPVRGR